LRFFIPADDRFRFAPSINFRPARMNSPQTGKTSGQQRRILTRGLAVFFLVTGARAQPVASEPKTETAAAMESVQVMGSRIKRLDREPVAPVFTLDREEIEQMGFESLGEVVRHLPLSNSTSIDPQFVTGFATGATSLNLRGLGVNSTLVLVNGRRAAPYGLPGGTGFTTLFDFNSVPLAAIDRIEILKDGASALYGADAAAGVVNLKLRTNYSGFSVSGLYGNTTNTDSALQSVNATWGTTIGKTSLLLVADWQTRHSLFLRDRDFSRTADGRSVGGQDGRSTIGFPGYVVVPTRDGAGRTPPAGTITGAIISPQGVLLTNPTVADFARGASLYNFNEDTALLPDVTSAGIYARIRHEVNERLYVFGEFGLRRNDGEFVQAATPVVNTMENTTSPLALLRLPFDNPYNPFGVDIDNFRFRLVAQGPRVRKTEATTSRYLAGIGGRIGAGDWTWESALLYSKNKVAVSDHNMATDAAVQNLLNQTSRATALNPFGPSAPGVVESLATTLERRAFVDIRQADLQANGHLWHLPAGEVGVAVGGEYRRERSQDHPDALASTGAVVALGGSSGLSAARRVSAGYVEFSIPVFSRLEVQIAGRHEKYSDFGTSDKPKFGLKYRPAKWLLLRAGFSQSFRAPDLSQLFTAQTIGFSGLVRDPLRPNDPVASVRTISGGNSSLRPELTDSYYAGAVVQVPRIKGLETSVDFWRFSQTNLISSSSLTTTLDLEATVPSGRVTRNAPTGDGLPGTINSVSIAFRNVSKAMTDGIDLALRYTRPSDLGRFVFSTAVTYVHSYESNYVEFVKTNGLPMFRGNAAVQWSQDRWSASLRADYLDGYAEPSSSIFGVGKPAVHRIEHSYTFTPQVSYRLGRATKLTLGARNVFDRDPPLALNKPELYDNLQVSGEGRFVFLRVTREF
jgi:iron complex outermembrane recepter protein